jgi:hypothetical protein
MAFGEDGPVSFFRCRQTTNAMATDAIPCSAHTVSSPLAQSRMRDTEQGTPPNSLVKKPR